MKIINLKSIVNSTIYSIFIILVLSLNSIPFAFAQTKSDEPKLTEAERKEVGEIAVQFSFQFLKNKDITPLVKKIFLDDFVERYRKEMLKKLGEDIWLLPILNYNVQLLAKDSANDWQKFYISGNNFYLSMTAAISEQVLKKNKEFRDSEVNKIFSPRLMKLFKKK